MFEKFFSKSKTLAKAKKSIYPRVVLGRPRHLIVIHPIKDITKVDIKYPLIDPFAHAEIKWVPENKGLIYKVVEPHLSDREEKLLKKI
ncbi:MAG: hypothetical protein JSW41_00825 [Candidatus Aenigmatarchaeota archaeon]|nr:MAG: hypothetical protein JSW41_00825 [Candidatus Aenigmarchaeota archaeon]